MSGTAPERARYLRVLELVREYLEAVDVSALAAAEAAAAAGYPDEITIQVDGESRTMTEAERAKHLRQMIGDKPPLQAWLRDRDEARAIPAARLELEKLARAEVERVQGVGAADVPVIPGDRVLFPGQMLDGIRDNGTGATRRALEMVRSGDASASPETLAMLEQVTATVGTRPLAEMTTPEWRAAFAVMHAFSSVRDDGRSLTADTLTADSVDLYRLCGIDPRQPTQCRTLFNALERISRRVLNVALVTRDGDAWAVVGKRAAIVEMSPLWSTDRRADADAIAVQWSALPPGEEWTGPLPDKYALTLPAIMRKIWRSLVLSADVLPALEAGARAVYGARQGFQAADMALFLELTQTVQGNELAPDGRGLLSYIDRDKFILDLHGTEHVAEKRRQRKYGQLTTAYEKSARVLVEGGLVVSWTPEKKGRRGPRDVFVLDPDKIHGLRDRVERAAQRKLAASRPRGKVKRKRAGIVRTPAPHPEQ